MRMGQSGESTAREGLPTKPRRIRKRKGGAQLKNDGKGRCGGKKGIRRFPRFRDCSGGPNPFKRKKKEEA